MKSIKPGRGPSKLGAAGSVFAAAFGIFWCVMAGVIGAGFMIPFGLLFIGYALYQAWYHYRNATSEERNSIVDIVDEDEEPDPLNVKYGQAMNKEGNGAVSDTADVKYCPYCGNTVQADFDYCPRCGKMLPD